MGAAARAGRDAYARACLVDASERRLASRKSILREEDQELHLHLLGSSLENGARTSKKISGDQLALRAIGANALLKDTIDPDCGHDGHFNVWFAGLGVVRAGPNPFLVAGFPESGEVW